MNLIDSHVLIWWWIAPQKVSRRVRTKLDSDRASIFVSAATAWEIATKQRFGKLRLPPAILDTFEQEVLAEGWNLLPIDARAARIAGSLNWTHRDPFDRVLAAQAMNEGFTLVSRDPVFATLPGLKILW
ncbi:MAG TPA: type II toxin-antitoxin system VapC family toxin [Chthoniobacterales bacterium]